jgi:DNA gyrase subunit B
MVDDPRWGVRLRPGMYVGDTHDGSGVQTCVLEVVGNAVDQYFAGRCRRIHVDVRADGEIVVTDDGPGIPGAQLERLVGERRHAPTADGHAPHVHLRPGAQGAGVAVVNYVSARFEVRTVHDGAEHRVLFQEGLLVEGCTSTPSAAPTGTTVAFRPDPTIFSGPMIDRVALSTRLDELSYLLPGLELSWSFAADPITSRGLAALVERAVRRPLGPTVHARGTVGDIDVEVAYGWDAAPGAPAVHSFANFGRTREGGTHVRGLLDALAVLRRTRRRDLESGLVAAVAVVLADVRYGNPCKDRVDNEEVRAAVRAVASDALSAWAAAFPDARDAVLARST